MRHKSSLTPLASLALLASLTVFRPALGKDQPHPFTVMTQNVYPGVDDLSAVIGAVLANDVPGILTSVEAAWQQVQATDFSTRSAALADGIAEKQPLLLALQEVALWRSQYPADFDPVPNATQVEYDFLDILLADLATRGLHYQAVAVSTNFDFEFPRLNPDGDGNPDPQDIRWTDRDVLLARTDVSPQELTVIGTASGRFRAVLEFGGGLAIGRGWVSADVVSKGRAFRMVGAHLEDMDLDVQAAQAKELRRRFGNPTLPTILSGDFNSNAIPDETSAVYQYLRKSGFEDAWSDVQPSQAGLTCCQEGTLTNATSQLSQRIDLVLYHGPFRTLSASLVGDDPADRLSGLWPSDHAGLAVTLALGSDD